MERLKHRLEAQHNNDITAGRLSDTNPWVLFHESLCAILETACVYDQLDAPSLASLELICRQIQSTEEGLRAHFEGNHDVHDRQLMSGLPHRSNLCICPALMKWTSAEASVETSILKERRKAREERTLQRPDPKHKGKKGQKGAQQGDDAPG